MNCHEAKPAVQIRVGALSVGGLVETAFLAFFINPQADGHLGDAKGDQGGDRAPANGDENGNGLPPDLGTHADLIVVGTGSAHTLEAENPGEDGTHDAADAVHSEDIERVIVAQLVLHLDGENVAEDGGNGADAERSGDARRARGGGDCHQPRDRARGRTDGSDDIRKQFLNGHPHHDRRGAGDLRDQHGHARSAVCDKCRARVEPEPTHPQQACTDDDQRDIVRGELHFLETFSRTDHETAHQSGDGRIDVDHRASCEIEHMELVKKSARAPRHVPDRQVGDREPDDAEDHHRAELDALREGTDDQRRGDDGESHLEHHENRLRVAPRIALRGDSFEEKFRSVSEEGIAIRGGERVAVSDPQQAHHTRHREALHEDGEHVLGAHQTAVEQRETRQRHQQDQHRGDEHERSVPGVEAAVSSCANAGKAQAARTAKAVTKCLRKLG